MVASVAAAVAAHGGTARATPNVGIVSQTLGQTFWTATNSGSYSFSITSSASNLALVVTVGATNGTTIASVVWDPDSMVSGDEQTLTCPAATNIVMSTTRRIAICRLSSPTASTAGRGRVIVTFAAAATDTFTSSAVVFSGVASFGTATGSGANQTFGSWTSCTGSTGYTCTTNVTTVADQIVYDMMGQGEPTDNTTRSYTAQGTGQRKVDDTASLNNSNNNRVATSLTIATGTTTTLKWLCGGATSANGVAQVILLINAASSITAARMGPVEATGYGSLGTRVTWRTEEEASHLGFHVWREVDGTRTRLGRGLLPGSMFATGDLPLAGPRTYELWDPAPVPGGRYWLEEMGTAGPTRWHGPIAPVTGDPARGRRLRTASSAIGLAPPAARRFATSSPTILTQAGPPPAEHTIAVPRAAATSRTAALSIDPTCANPPAWRPSVKIGVTAPGWVRVDAAALVAAGLPADVDPARLALYADGAPVAMEVTGTERVASIAFFGTGLDTRETDTRFYWLVADDPSPRRLTRAAPPAPAREIGDYTARVERRERTIYFAAVLNGRAENFFGAPITDKPVTQTLTTSALGDQTDARLEVALQGATVDRHDVRVSLAGVALGDLAWTGRAAAVSAFDVPASLLREGANDVVLASQTAGHDVSLVAHVALTYRRRFQAAGAAWPAVVPAGAGTTLTGLDAPGARILDVQDPAAPVELPASIAAASDGTFTARVVAPPGEGDHALWVFTPSGVASASFVLPNRPSSLCLTAGSDLAVVAPAPFLDALGPYVAARRAAGWSVDLVDVEDVYDEMSAGAHTADALTRFIRRRAPRTRYLLLVGDASLDPRNFLGKDVPDLVPTGFIDATIETASDDALADLDGDGVPALAVGRWPAHTPEDVSGLVARTLVLGAASPFAGGALVIAGASDDGGFDFTAPARALLGSVPGRGDFLDATGLAPDAARAQLASLWGLGPSFVAYLGHGSQGVWQGLLSMDDLAATASSGPPSVVAAMTCLNGFFQDVYQDCLAERLVRADNGPAAVWASSTLEDAGAQGQLAHAFAAALAQSHAVGEAVLEVKRRNADVARAMILFGDPTLFGGPPPPAPKPGFAVAVRPGAAAPIGGAAAHPPPSPAMPPENGCAVAPRSPGAGGATGLLLAALALVIRARRRPSA